MVPKKAVPADRPKLTREIIVETSLTAINEVGVDKFSMRQLAKMLGVDPMAIYHHIPNKAAIFDAIVEYIWHGVKLPPKNACEKWDELLYQVFSNFRHRLLQHPQAVTLVGTRPALTPSMLQLIETLLERLAQAGLSEPDAMVLIDCLTGFTIGKVLAQTVETNSNPQQMATAMSAITFETHPKLAKILSHGYAYDPKQQFEKGLKAMLAGWANSRDVV